MKTFINDYDIHIELDAEISGLPERIILTSSDKDNDSVWIYTKTQTYYGYQEVPRRVIEKKK